MADKSKIRSFMQSRMDMIQMEYPYINGLLSTIELSDCNHEVPTMAVAPMLNGNTALYYNPEFVAKIPSYAYYIIKHEIKHIIYDHLSVNDGDHRLHNWAMDTLINMRIKWPSIVIRDVDLKVMDPHGEVDIFEIMKEYKAYRIIIDYCDPKPEEEDHIELIGPHAMFMSVYDLLIDDDKKCEALSWWRDKILHMDISLYSSRDWYNMYEELTNLLGEIPDLNVLNVRNIDNGNLGPKRIGDRTSEIIEDMKDVGIDEENILNDQSTDDIRLDNTTDIEDIKLERILLKYLSNSKKHQYEETIYRPNRRWGYLKPGLKKKDIGVVNIAIDTSSSIDMAIMKRLNNSFIKESEILAKNLEINLFLFNSKVYSVVYDWNPKQGIKNIKQGSTNFDKPLMALCKEYKKNRGICIMFTDGAANVPSPDIFPNGFVNNLLWLIWGQKGCKYNRRILDLVHFGYYFGKATIIE
jgi:predicted metal-dependent peptidase